MPQLFNDLTHVSLVQVHLSDLREGLVELQVTSPELIDLVNLFLRFSHTTACFIDAFLGKVDVVDLIADGCTRFSIQLCLPLFILAKLSCKLFRIDEALVAEQSFYLAVGFSLHRLQIIKMLEHRL